MNQFSSYIHIEVEEILKESDTAFLVQFDDGEQGWILKKEIAFPTTYSEGDKNVTLQLFT